MVKAFEAAKNQIYVTKSDIQYFFMLSGHLTAKNLHSKIRKQQKVIFDFEWQLGNFSASKSCSLTIRPPLTSVM